MVQFFGNSSEIHAGWKNGPNYRGTGDILSSCLVTLTLCVWTAVHLNVPEPGKAKVNTFRRKPIWLLIGLFAPELVVWVAYTQYRQSRELCSLMREVYGDPPWVSSWKKVLRKCTWRRKETKAVVDSTDRLSNGGVDVEANTDAGSSDSASTKRNYPWTPTHAHFALMGGFAIRERSSDTKILPAGLKSVFLTGRGIHTLAKLHPEAVPDISPSTIKDKSKANGLAKLLVCIQALWFCTQCIGRLAQGLDVTLLELCTFAHAICALIMFLCWARKPLDVEEPVFIDIETAPDLCAAFCFHDGIRSTWPLFFSKDVVEKPSVKLNDRLYAIFSNRSRRPLLQNPTVVNAQLEMRRTIQSRTQLLAAGQRSPIFTVLEPDTARLSVGEALVEGDYCFAIEKILSNSYTLTSSTLIQSIASKSHIDLSTEDVRYMKQVGRGVRQMDEGKVPRYYSVHRQIFNWPYSASTGLDTHTWGTYCMAFTLSSLFYGGVHTLAWNASFPLQSQLLLWRIACLIILSTGPCYVVFTGFFETENSISLLEDLKHSALTRRRLTGRWLLPLAQLRTKIPSIFDDVLIYLLIFTIPAVVLLYVAGRVFLVVESFVCLTYSSELAFREPDWSRYWPHVN